MCADFLGILSDEQWLCEVQELPYSQPQYSAVSRGSSQLFNNGARSTADLSKLRKQSHMITVFPSVSQIVR